MSIRRVRGLFNCYCAYYSLPIVPTTSTESDSALSLSWDSFLRVAALLSPLAQRGKEDLSDVSQVPSSGRLEHDGAGQVCWAWERGWCP